MRKVRFWFETNYAGCEWEEVFEFGDDVTEQDIEAELNDWVQSQIEYGYEEIEEEDK